MSRRHAAHTFLLGMLVLAGCTADLTPEQRVERLQDVLVRGVAHAEIEEWPEAIELFSEATSLADGDPVVAFNLAVVYFRSGDLDAAVEWLGRLGDQAPESLRARAEYLKGKLALEDGDAQGEAEAYRRAAELDAGEPAYPYSLSQVIPRLGGEGIDAEVGALLSRTAELWPGNARIGAELAQWSLGQASSEVRERGVELVVELAAGLKEIEPLVTRGLEEYAADRERSPVSLRRALNLLRPGKQFQADSALLESRLAVLPLPRPVAEGLSRRSSPGTADVALEQATLLREGLLTANEEIVQVELLSDVVAEEADNFAEASMVLLTQDAVWFLGADADSIEPITTLDGQSRQILVGELDGDEQMEILVLTETEVSLWGRSDDGGWTELGLEPALAVAGDLRNALLMDFEHDGDLDLLAIDSAGQLVLITHRGEAGLGEPEPAPLPDFGPVDLLRSVDLDGDVDQDLLLAEGGTVRVLTNWRQGDYRLGQELAISDGQGDCEELLSLDYDGDGLFDVVGVVGGRLVFLANRGSAGLVVDEGAGERVRELLGGDHVDALGAGDMDLDGDLDLLAAHSDESGGARLSILREQGGSGVAGQIDLSSGAPLGVIATDLDGDRDPDSILWGEAGITTVRSTGAGSQGWLGVSLRGLKGKVPLDGRGTRVDVRFGLDRRSFELERPEIVLGLGGRKPSLVKVTWPNGVSEYLFDPPVNTHHVVEQELRIEGSCPFLYASDGREMRFVTDILGLAPLGMLAGPDRYVPADPEEYLRLPDWVPSDSSIELRITEELREVAYLDQTELVVVDAPEAVEVYNGERWIEGPIKGLELRLLSPFSKPVGVKSDAGADVLELVADLDGRYLTNHSAGRLYQGAVAPHRLEIELPAESAQSGRAALVLTGWLHWGNTSMNVARAQDPDGAPLFPFLEVPADDGSWKRVDLDVGLPAGKTKPIVVDLSGVVNPRDPRVRVTTDFEVYWDQIAVSELLSMEVTEHRLHRLSPAAAELSYGGFSSWYRASENGPYLFDYSDRRPFPWRQNASGARPIAWQEHEGFYTRFGDVRELVSAVDDHLVIFGAGEELALSFDVTELPPLPEGWQRTLFLHSEGWEKDGDPNIACGQTVGPLPSRDSLDYPCARIAELESSGGALQASSPEADRWVSRDRLERRVEAWASGDLVPSERR